MSQELLQACAEAQENADHAGQKPWFSDFSGLFWVPEPCLASFFCVTVDPCVTVSFGCLSSGFSSEKKQLTWGMV